MRRFIPLFVLGGALLLPLAASAQERPPMPPVRQDDGARPDRSDTDQWLDRLDSELDLTPDQRRRLRALHEQRVERVRERRENMRERREDRRERRDEMREEARERHDAFVADVERILTPAQRERYAQMRQKHDAQMREHRGERRGEHRQMRKMKERGGEHERGERKRDERNERKRDGQRARPDSVQIDPRR